MNDFTVILAPDSFKGSATAAEVAEALAAGLARARPDATLIQAPMADGGEGTLACVAAARAGRWQHAEIEAIHGQYMTADWYHTDDGLAVIESASVLGLPLIETQAASPPLMDRGSGALGRLLQSALDGGARRIAIGLGGSACNDAGLGLLMALGCQAYDRHGASLAPTMAGLLALDSLTFDGLDARLAGTELDILCDVDNPLLGETGASRVYGPQKGLTPDQIATVEQAFERLAVCCNARGDATSPGSGAAGGLGFALATLGGRLSPGAQTLMEMAELPTRMATADLVITGEGRSDTQTLSGKLPLAIAQAAAPTPTVLVCGDMAADARTALEAHFRSCHTLVEPAGSVDAARAEPLRWLETVGASIGRAYTSHAPP